MTMGFSTSDDAANAPAERMTGSQAIVRTLEDLGVTDVFGLPGGAILPTYDPLYAVSYTHLTLPTSDLV